MEPTSPSGIIFNIQRFSVHDGPGIRTTVFLKGCPLRCKWCHNPEGLSKDLQLQFFKEKCIGCGACGDRKALSDAEKCPAEALQVCGRQISVSQLTEELLKDSVFYAGDGGVTFSGGECLLQADFVAAALKEAKKHGLHTAIDTCGNVSWEELEKTLASCDLYLYDVKCLSSEKHKEYTGANNERILANLKKLSATGKEIWIRIPVIPEFNDSREEMENVAVFLSGLPAVRRVTLMPYHVLGSGKYETLGLHYPYDTSLRISDTALEEFESILKENGLNVI